MTPRQPFFARRGDRVRKSSGSGSGSGSGSDDARVALASAREMACALGLRGPAAKLAELAFRALSGRLARVLADFDRDTRARGLAWAAARACAGLGARVSLVTHAAPRAERARALLVVANHPGAYDALALALALERDDLAILAADRAFLRALPTFAERHLIFIDERATPAARASAVRRACAHLRAGGALLHFGAGAIEPDPRFASRDAPILGAWRDGTAVLARAAWRARGDVVPALVRGVHSPRAKRMRAVRWAEARGVTTVAPLLQVALPWLRDVDVEVAIGGAVGEVRWEADDATVARIRDACEALTRGA